MDKALIWILALMLGQTPVGTMAGIMGSSASFDVGFDFRNTQAYVTDPTCCTYEISTTVDYPTTRTVNGFSVTFGWETNTAGQNTADRSATVDARIAGIEYVSNTASTSTFRVNLPVSGGTYNISFVVGDAPAGNSQTNYILVEDTTTSKITYQPLSTSATQMGNVNGGTCTTPWTSCITATSSQTFSTNILRVVIGGTVAGNSTCLSHLRITRTS